MEKIVRRTGILAGAIVLSLSLASYAQTDIILESYSDGQNPDSFKAVSGNWIPSDSKSKAPGVKATKSVFNTADQTPGVARFTPEIPADGKYDVYVTYPQSGNAAGVVYKIHSADGDQTVTQDQNGRDHSAQHPSDKWIRLGTYGFHAGKDGYIEIADPTTGQRAFTGEPNARLYADSVRLVTAGTSILNAPLAGNPPPGVTGTGIPGTQIAQTGGSSAVAAMPILGAAQAVPTASSAAGAQLQQRSSGNGIPPLPDEVPANAMPPLAGAPPAAKAAPSLPGLTSLAAQQSNGNNSATPSASSTMPSLSASASNPAASNLPSLNSSAGNSSGLPSLGSAASSPGQSSNGLPSLNDSSAPGAASSGLPSLGAAASTPGAGSSLPSLNSADVNASNPALPGLGSATSPSPAASGLPSLGSSTPDQSASTGSGLPSLGSTTSSAPGDTQQNNAAVPGLPTPAVPSLPTGNETTGLPGAPGLSPPSDLGGLGMPGALPTPAPAFNAASAPPAGAMQNPAGLQWMYDFGSAQAAARETKKNILVFFVAPGNREVARYENDYFTNPAVRQMLDGFVLMKSNFPENTKFAFSLGVFAASTIAITDAGGTKVGDILQMPASPDELAKHLSELK
jgi:hypothetical protein